MTIPPPMPSMPASTPATAENAGSEIVLRGVNATRPAKKVSGRPSAAACGAARATTPSLARARDRATTHPATATGTKATVTSQ